MMAEGSRLYFAVTVLMCAFVSINGVGLNDLLERASQLSDKLHSLSTSLTNDLDSHFPPVGRVMMPRPSMCHTSSLQIPNDKDQALKVPEDELLSLARSLLLAWSDPLALLSSEASSLAHPERNTINSKTKELQDNIDSLGAGLEHVFHKMGSSSDNLSSLPFYSNSLGQDKTSRLVNFHFLLSCFRRDSHKIDSFLKVLRCRAAKKRPEMC
ncbi:prolactin isoform X1 [Megalobrama amblycephala]|uniref:prolactin isoform X1 n=2 Tax=Megalobrama amblycephala TaxID=75352 RepID=UPI0020144FEA|nr:prolactin isoform X1 [Megalobrama amblycephala]